MNPLTEYLSEQNNKILQGKNAVFEFVPNSDFEKQDKQGKFSKFVFGKIPQMFREKKCGQQKFESPFEITLKNISLEEPYSEAILGDIFKGDFQVHFIFEKKEKFFISTRKFVIYNVGESPIQVEIDAERGCLKRLFE